MVHSSHDTHNNTGTRAVGRSTGILIALCALLWLLPAQASAAADQTCQVPPGGSIQTQLNDNSCSTIEIPAGTFTENLTINRSVILQGAGNMETIIDGDSAGRVITIDGMDGMVTVTLRDLRVTNGDASDVTPSVGIHRIGGGILADNGATLYMHSVRVDENTGFEGPTRGAFGGGVGVHRGATLYAYDSYIENNVASRAPGTGFGGGLAVVDGAAYITRTLVAENYANFRPGTFSGDGTGGGLYAAGVLGAGQAVLSIWDSEVRDNIAANAEGGGDGSGGGLRVGSSEDTRIQIYNTRFENNTAAGSNAEGDSGAGGGIAVTTGTYDAYIHIENSVLQGNLANARLNIPGGANNARGGGLYADPGSSDGRIVVHLLNTNLIENIAKAGTGPGDGQGGGIYARRADITVQGGAIQGNIAGTNNAAGGQGGGIRMSGVGPTALTIEGATLLDNVARIGTGGSFPNETGQGGGIQASGSGAVITVTNTILGDNRAASSSGGTGAGIYVGGSARGTVVHATVAAAETTPAQAIFHANTGGMAITNTIVSNYNTGIHNQGSTGSVVARYILFWGNTSNTVGSVGDSVTPTRFEGNPMFVDPLLRDYHIQDNSAAIDAGTDAGILVDIDGDTRPQGADFDIGADEYAEVAPSSVSIAGPGSVIESQSYTYTAQVNPPNAQTPLSYTWDPEPDSGQDTSQVAYSWGTTGTRMITVTATNDAGSAIATRTITVTSQPITVTALSIMGPNMGSVNQQYGFTATVSPPDASAPITYTWSPPPDSGQNNATAAYTWNAPGVKTITATAQNTGAPVTATHSITIETIGIMGASISGPSSGVPDESYTYNATVNPADASLPITYTWSPMPISGQGTSQAVYSWSETGTQQIQVAVENAVNSAVATRTVNIETAGVSDVSIDGPDNVAVDQPNSYTAMVSPANAMPPIEYTWAPAPDTGQGMATAVYTWTTPGTRVITVTAQNLGGTASAVATRTVTVSSEPIGISGASITGPTNLVVDRQYYYTGTVTPLNATAPFTYTWSPTPTEGQGTPHAQYAWSEPGSRTITLTAQNNNGSAVMARTVNVSSQVNAVSGVGIGGPTSGTVNMAYTFTATVSPSEATDPIQYIWSPAPESGQGSAQATYRWNSAGSQSISVTAQNEEGMADADHTINISEPDQSENRVEVRDNSFSPDTITIQVGETVTWERLQGLHNVRADDGSFGNELNNTWDTYSHTFTEPGTYAYYCEAHGGPNGIGMSGVVIVEDESSQPEEIGLYIPIIERN